MWHFPFLDVNNVNATIVELGPQIHNKMVESNSTQTTLTFRQLQFYSELKQESCPESELQQTASSVMKLLPW